MQPEIGMISLITDRFDEMLRFYNEVLGFPIKQQLEKYVEFENPTVKFAIATKQIMVEVTGDESYLKDTQSHSFELAFPAGTPARVDEWFEKLVIQGAGIVKAPADMPWGQRAAFFSDPDGNVHEIYAPL